MIKRFLRSAADRAWRFLLSSPEVQRTLTGRQNSQQQPTQLLLKWRYRELVANGRVLPRLEDVEFRCHSQNGEDGILLFLFSAIGTTNKVVVEIGSSDGTECNSANLILNHGWTGLLLDASEDDVARGRRFYARSHDAWVYPPRLVCAHVTRENVDSIVAAGGTTGNIDLLSIDVDGMDYWIWEALQVVSPRVVVVEYQGSFDAATSVTAAYRADFRHDATYSNSGASLAALVKLAARKGYRLVGAERYGINAFFMRNDVGSDLFPEAAVESCLQHPKMKAAIEWRKAGGGSGDWVEVP